jgi:hypothetical protein
MTVSPETLKGLADLAVNTGSIITNFKLKSFLVEQVA